jgi:hypothetical protein
LGVVSPIRLPHDDEWRDVHESIVVQRFLEPRVWERSDPRRGSVQVPICHVGDLSMEGDATAKGFWVPTQEHPMSPRVNDWRLQSISIIKACSPWRVLLSNSTHRSLPDL